MLYNDDDDDDFNASKTCNELRMKQNIPNGIGRLRKYTIVNLKYIYIYIARLIANYSVGVNIY